MWLQNILVWTGNNDLSFMLSLSLEWCGGYSISIDLQQELKTKCEVVKISTSVHQEVNKSRSCEQTATSALFITQWHTEFFSGVISATASPSLTSHSNL